MAAARQGLVALQGRVVADFQSKSSSRLSSSPRTRDRGVQRGFAMGLPRSRSFKTFRTIQKLPRLKRSGSRVFMRTTTSAMQSDKSNIFMSNPMSAKYTQDDDLMFKFDNDDDDEDDNDNGTAVDENTTMVDTVNAVLADIVDGQKYIKETGRTKARPMKRRGLVVSLALGAFRGPLNDVDSRLGSLRRTPSTSRLVRTPSCSGFGCTLQLMSQMSVGSPHTLNMH